MYAKQAINLVYLLSANGPHGELVEQSGCLRWAWIDGLREHMKKWLWQVLADNLRRNSLHDAFQQMKVVFRYLLEIPPVTHSNVHGKM